MKKVLIVAAATGLFALAACNGGTNNTAQDNAIAGQEANAAMYDAAADNATNEAVAADLHNGSDAAENAAEAAENKM